MTTDSLAFRAVVLVSFWAAYAASSLGQAQRPHQRPCTQREAMAADADIGHLQTWSDVYRSFKQFAQCDDASIGEGYSDRVMRLLVHHWNELPELTRLTSANVDFRTFVIRHVDELASPGELRAVQQNAQSHCPSGSKWLCADLDRRVRYVLR